MEEEDPDCNPRMVRIENGNRKKEKARDFEETTTTTGAGLTTLQRGF